MVEFATSKKIILTPAVIAFIFLALRLKFAKHSVF